jgi:hypothetical protein
MLRSLAFSAAVLIAVPAAAQSWFYVEELDPFTDALKQFAFGIPQGVEPSNQGPFVRLGCYDPAETFPVGLTISWGVPVRDVYAEGDIDMAAVEVRFGRTNPVYLGMSMSADRTQTYAMDPISGGIAALGGGFLQALLPGWDQPEPLLDPADFHRALYAAGGDRLALRTQAAGGQEVTYIIGMDGFAEATAAFRDHCKPAGARTAPKVEPEPAPPVAAAPAAPKDPLAGLSDELRAKLDIPLSKEVDFLDGKVFTAEPMVAEYLLSIAAPTGEAFPQGARVAYAKLPFYPGAYMVVGIPEDDPARRFFAIVDPELEVMISLDGTSPPIHLYNAMRPPVLNAITTPQYLFFFGYFVHAEDGGFYVADRLDGSLYRNTKTRNPEDEAKLAEVIKTPLCRPEADDAWLCSAVLAYSNAVFASDMRITPDGKVQMVSDQTLLEGLTMRPVVAKLK